MVDVLLTGADGQLGRALSRRAKAAGLTLRGFGRGGLDITDGEAVLQAVERFRPKTVINAAAYTAVDDAESDQAAAFAINRDGPAHLSRACALYGAAILHLSTDYVFDGTKTGAYTEDDPAAPLGVYGTSKLAGEEAVRDRCPNHVILRTAWVYGADGRNFVKTILRLAAERDELGVVDDQRGCPTFAGDLAEAILAIARSVVRDAMPADGFGTFHCTGQGETTWCGLAREIVEIARPRLARMPKVAGITTAQHPTPARRPANSVLDNGRLWRVHGLRLRPWEAALAEMLDAFPPRDGRRAKG